MQSTLTRRNRLLVWTLLVIGALVIGATHGGLAVLAVAAVILFALL
jgi:hypothetical protein